MKKEIIHTFVVLAYKESIFLEDCVKSVLNQKYKSNVVIATTTDNKFIRKIAKKYKLEVIVGKHTSIGGDFDFAIRCAKTKLVTIAHQDDIYDSNFSYEIVKAYEENNDAIILFSHYYEIKDYGLEYTNTNLKIKKILLHSLKNVKKAGILFRKRNVIRFGNAICCPAVTFNVKKIKYPVFECDFKCDVDWNAWEKLSLLDGKFIYINKQLMGHRIHNNSTTTEIIHDNIRIKEDFEMFKRFWPNCFANIICKFYKLSEKNNEKN